MLHMPFILGSSFSEYKVPGSYFISLNILNMLLYFLLLKSLLSKSDCNIFSLICDCLLCPEDHRDFSSSLSFGNRRGHVGRNRARMSQKALNIFFWHYMKTTEEGALKLEKLLWTMLPPKSLGKLISYKYKPQKKMEAKSHTKTK